jgi:hypothetical protein
LIHRAVDFRDFLGDIDRQTEPAWRSTSSASSRRRPDPLSRLEVIVVT